MKETKTKIIRKEILEKVKDFYLSQEANSKFAPGKTFIPFAGRVYNEKELVFLVDASLDFWLTTGRYARKFEEEFSDFLKI